MSRSKEAIINEILNKYTHNLADVGKCVHPLGRLGGTKRKGFTRFSKMFCDSMVFWAPVNYADEKVKGISLLTSKPHMHKSTAMDHTLPDLSLSRCLYTTAVPKRW